MIPIIHEEFQGLRVTLRPDVPGDHAEALEKCKRVFEDFCICRTGLPQDFLK